MSDIQIPGDEVLDLWLNALTEYGQLCRGKTWASLEGRSFRRYDAQGLDPISAAYGRIQALQALHPVLEEELLTPHPVAIAQGCTKDVREEHERSIIEAWKRVTTERPE